MKDDKEEFRKARRKNQRKYEESHIEEEYCYKCSDFHKQGNHTI